MPSICSRLSHVITVLQLYVTSASLTVASRLAENPKITVAVIEAGGFYEADDGNISVVPGYCAVNAGAAPNNTGPLEDWGFVTTPQNVSYKNGELIQS